jgi:hypothetical protein
MPLSSGDKKCQKGKKNIFFVSAVLDHLTSNPRTKGSNPATVTEREKMMKKSKK